MDTTTCLWIIGSMAVAVVGEASYIVRMHLKIAALYDERVGALERQLAKLEAAEARGPEGGK